MLHHQAEAGGILKGIFKNIYLPNQTLCLSGEEGPCNLGSFGHLQLKKKKKEKKGLHSQIENAGDTPFEQSVLAAADEIGYGKVCMLHSR